MPRPHRVIREELVIGPQDFAYDVECTEFENLLITWSATTDSVQQPPFLVLCPSINRPVPLSASANYPSSPAPPSPGQTVYSALGIGMQNRFPLPPLVTVGISVPADCTIAVKIEGDLSEPVFVDPARKK